MQEENGQTSIPVLYRDDDFIAVNKPANLLVHRTAISADTRFLLTELHRQTGQFLYPVHRLDRATSGVIIFAFSPESAGILNRMFHTHEVKKTYLAVVRGYTEISGTIDYNLAAESGNVQKAVTGYQRLATLEIDVPAGKFQTSRYSLLQVNPQTGRRHQIRRHLAHIFHPVIGDVKHGDGYHNRLFREHFNIHRLLLHAGKLEFTHPFRETKISISAPFDSEWEIILKEFGDIKTVINGH